MAPEVKTHFNNGTKPETKDIVTLQKQDIYQLGLILYEMSHKIKTNMQKTILFRALGQKREIADLCPLSEKDIEYKLIMAMTEQDPTNRPSIEEIQSVWLPLLNLGQENELAQKTNFVNMRLREEKFKDRGKVTEENKVTSESETITSQTSSFTQVILMVLTQQCQDSTTRTTVDSVAAKASDLNMPFNMAIKKTRMFNMIPAQFFTLKHQQQICRIVG